MAIENIVIVGGGTAGWMTAAALSRLSAQRKLSVTLIESEEIGTIGVGEATIPPFLDFNRLLEIDEAELLSAVQGSFKLGIQFVNWGAIGDSYIHPFGNYGYQIDGISFHHIWHKYKTAGDKRPIQVFNIETMAAHMGRFARTADYQAEDLPPINHAYHIDAGRYAKFLRAYSEKRGVVRREGKVQSVSQNGENGNITSVTMENGDIISGDFFVDCSGFRGLLIEQTMKTGYQDWLNFLPCNRAIAIPSERNAGEGPLPYTRSTAHSAGWQWQIPLQHRNGNGHVYAGDYMSDDEALDILVKNISGKKLAEPNFLKFIAGRRNKFWNKNVVAIGLSAGFVEPLESTAIHLIYSGINKLISLLCLDGVSQTQEDAFNRLTEKEYNRIRDFIILHYKATNRDDSDFWNYCRNMAVPDTLTEKMELFRQSGQIFREDDELFTETSWAAVMLGQGISMQGHNAMADALREPSTRKEYDGIEQSIMYVVNHMPSHEDYLKQYCPAPKL